MNKLIATLVAFLSFITTSSFADIKFEIVYTDKPGEGFHIRPEAQKSLEEAVALVFSWLDHDAVIRIEVESYVDHSERTLASCGVPKLEKIPRIYHTYLASKILLNEHENGREYDATIYVNFAHEHMFVYGDDIARKIDFKTVIIHELTHALGFISRIQKTPDDESESFMYEIYADVYLSNLQGDAAVKYISPTRFGEEVIFTYNMIKNGGRAFMYFDTLLVDAQGNNVVDSKNLKFIRQDLLELEDGDPDKTLYFPVEEKDGLVLYPLNGMDASHFGNTLAVMKFAQSRGLAFRQWSNLERQIMQALGYKLKPVKVDTWVWKWLKEDDGVVQVRWANRTQDSLCEYSQEG